MRRLLVSLRWRLFSPHERHVIRRALQGKLPYIGGGASPYGAHYGESVTTLSELIYELETDRR